MCYISKAEPKSHYHKSLACVKADHSVCTGKSLHPGQTLLAERKALAFLHLLVLGL